MRQARGVLPRPKDWVMSDPRSDGLFIFVRLRPDIDPAAVVAWLARVQQLIEQLRAAVDDEGRRLATVAAGFGTSFFIRDGQSRFSGVELPAGLAQPTTVAPPGEPIQGDVIFYLMTLSEAVAARFLTGLWDTKPDVAALSVERGFRRPDDTEVFGFKDGVRNVARSDRPEIVFVNPTRHPEEPWWAEDGTYLTYMRIAQHLDAFAALDQAAQERMIGRAADGRRLDLPKPGHPKDEPDFSGAEPPPACHVRKSGPRGAVRDQTTIFRRGLPFVEAGPDGNLRVGMHFVSFQASLDQFRVVFDRWMMNPDFPHQGAGQDVLFAGGFVTIERWGFFFVPPHTDDPIGAVMFQPKPRKEKPKTGRVAVRKRVLDQNSTELMVDLAGFRFRVLDVNGQQVGGEFQTDAAGHGLSDELPTDAAYKLEELPPPAPFTPQPPLDFVLQSAREVVRVDNRLPAGSSYNPTG